MDALADNIILKSALSGVVDNEFTVGSLVRLKDPNWLETIMAVICVYESESGVRIVNCRPCGKPYTVNFRKEELEIFAHSEAYAKQRDLERQIKQLACVDPLIRACLMEAEASHIGLYAGYAMAVIALSKQCKSLSEQLLNMAINQPGAVGKPVAMKAFLDVRDANPDGSFDSRKVEADEPTMIGNLLPKKIEKLCVCCKLPMEGRGSPNRDICDACRHRANLPDDTVSMPGGFCPTCKRPY